jgi:hypothetical protein
MRLVRMACLFAALAMVGLGCDNGVATDGGARLDGSAIAGRPGE